MCGYPVDQASEFLIDYWQGQHRRNKAKYDLVIRLLIFA
jgi:hypothetical protein